jgi:hypothetical protein
LRLSEIRGIRPRNAVARESDGSAVVICQRHIFRGTGAADSLGEESLLYSKNPCPADPFGFIVPFSVAPLLVNRVTAFVLTGAGAERNCLKMIVKVGVQF